MKIITLKIKVKKIIPALMFAAAAVLGFNQWMLASGSFSALGQTSLGIDTQSILAPALLAQGEASVLSGYQTKVKKFPTISAQLASAKTGDAMKDAMTALIPRGAPFYGSAAGVSFDDPLNSLQVWGKHERAISLSGVDDERYQKIASVFTCDFCCGSPAQPTRIINCGCSHARAWRGIAKWFIKNHGSQYNDAQIMGEMSRWKALWYPGPVVKRVLEEMAKAPII